MSSGYFIRAKRDGEWKSLDVCELTDREFDTWAEVLTPQELIKWLRALQKLIRDAK